MKQTEVCAGSAREFHGRYENASANPGEVFEGVVAEFMNGGVYFHAEYLCKSEVKRFADWLTNYAEKLSNEKS